MQVTNEIRQAFLFAVQDLEPQSRMIQIAFEAIETEELMKWLTLFEKVAFGRKLLELTGAEMTQRTLTTDLTEDR